MEQELIQFGESRKSTETFIHDQFGRIRVQRDDNDEPLFCAMDLCSALGYANGRKAVADHCDEEDVTKRYTPTNGGMQQLTYVNESGMYALMLGCNLPEARRFKHWVTSEVLPSIRKTGSFGMECGRLPQTFSEALRMLADKVEESKVLAIENSQQRMRLDEQQPKVEFANAMLSSPDSILIGEMAKILCQNGYVTGEKRLYEQLRRENYLISSGTDYNMPYQRYLEMGLFEITKGTRTGNGGVQRITRTTKVTPKGQQYFINRYCHIQ